MEAFYSNTLCAQNLSHEQRDSSIQNAKQALIDQVQKRGNLPYVSVEKQLDLIEQLSSFELGEFLIARGGLNGYWTHYVVSHPTKGRLTNLNTQGKPFHPFEAYLLNHAPSCLATQQRFSLFKQQIQKHIFEGCTLASIPCGLMGDLLDLDYSLVTTFTLNGIDLDAQTLLQAKSYAEEKGLLSHCHFFQKDAWELHTYEKLDLIASNGLSIYEKNDEKVVGLYRQFYHALKPGGLLITSFLTPPPAPGLQTEWNLSQVNPQDALLQKILFVDILDAKWQVYRKEEVVKAQLKEAGFSEVSILYDEAHIFPTAIAKK